jgi:hypothetical protein
MSIYAALWRLRFPRAGDAYLGCGWADVLAQGVPAHIGTPTPGYGYETGDRTPASCLRRSALASTHRRMACVPSCS